MGRWSPGLGPGKGRVPGALLPFLLSRILQPMAFLAVWEQHRYWPSIQKQGWYFCTRSLLYRITVAEEGSCV